MLGTPPVSVIVPVYNGANTIDACIESLLALDYPAERRELIFVDNASTDKTAQILDRYREKIRIAFEAKRGPAAARNRGLRVARHEIVAMTDADCTVDRHWLRHLLAPLEDPGIGLAGGKILAQRPCNAIERFGEKIHDHHSAIEVWQPPYVITMNWASKKSRLNSIGYFDERFLRQEDGDLSYRLFSTGVKFAFAPEAIVYHANERTYGGLFHEGYLHGFYSVQVIKKHRLLLKQHGHRPIQGAAYSALLHALKQSLFDRQPEQARCELVFNSGKRLGKLCGSVRFVHLEL